LCVFTATFISVSGDRFGCFWPLFPLAGFGFHRTQKEVAPGGGQNLKRKKRKGREKEERKESDIE
jgi:hypothetical protein